MSAQALLGEATTQILVANNITLGVPAIKIDEIVATVNDLNCTVIPNKVIVQGTLHKQIFFVDTTDVVRHQAEDISFSGFIDFPGALQGNACSLQAVIEFVGFQLLEPTDLKQTAIISVTAQLYDPPPGELFLDTAPFSSDRFLVPGVYSTSGQHQGPGRVYTLRLGADSSY